MRWQSNCWAMLAAGSLLACGRHESRSGETVAHAARPSTAHEQGPRPNRTHPGGGIITTIRRRGRPFGIAISRTGVVYCTLLDAATLVRTTLTGDSVGTVPVAEVPTDVAFSPAGTRAFVTNQRTGTIGILDTRTNTQVDVIPVEGDPFRVAVGPEGQRVYATTNLGNLVEIDATTHTVTWTVSLGGNLNGLAVNAAGTRIYAGDVAGKVYELGATGDLLRSIVLPGSPQGLALSTDGRELYAAGEAGDFVVLDLETGAEVARTPLGAGGFGIAVTPDQAQVWITAPGAGRVFVLDRLSRTIVATIGLGGAPRRIAFDHSGNTAAVADEAGAIHLVR